ncbi:IclR family transcriptional regulator [Heliomarina baculiformis]|uniref:IclR family transcriptional regulator n=1 Tax=Heliomarina baculiformis TaxID=2872036 RepID=UPI001EE1C432|nr:IclR family transcriptional regulator [Heliomarina baculiformis]
MPDSKETTGRKGDHQNVARAAQVIDIIAASGPNGLRMTDVTERSGLGGSTVHRLLAGLIEHGLIDQDPETNRYLVGLKMVSWTAAALSRYGLAPYADASLERLCAATSDTVYLSYRSGNDAVCVDRREGNFPIKTLTLALGDHRPLGIGAGSLSLLAFQPEDDRRRLLAEDAVRRATYGFDTAYLEEKIAETRDRGFSLNDGKLISGMSGLGAPILRRDGTAVAALSIAAISSRLEGERLTELSQMLREEAQTLAGRASDVLDAELVKRHSFRKVQT